MVQKRDRLAGFDCLHAGLRVLRNLIMKIRAIVRVKVGIQGNIMIAC